MMSSSLQSTLSTPLRSFFSPALVNDTDTIRLRSRLHAACLATPLEPSAILLTHFPIPIPFSKLLHPGFYTPAHSPLRMLSSLRVHPRVLTFLRRQLPHLPNLFMSVPSPTTPPPWASRIISAQRTLFQHYAPELSFTEHRIPINLSTSTTTTTPSVNMVMASNPSSTASGVLVLLHGWGAGLAVFSRALPHLASRFSAVYMVDVPGMGASSREPFPRKGSVSESLRYFLPSLDQLYASLSASDAFRTASHRHLAAHSLGAYISVEWLLTKEQELFDSVVLVSPVGVPERPEPAKKPGMVMKMFAALWRAGATPQAVLRTIPRPLARRLCRGYISSRYTRDLSDEERELLTEYYLRVSRAPGASERAVNTLLEPGAWAKVPLIKRLPGLGGNVAFVYGDRDWMDWRMGERVRQEMSGPTRLFRVKDADHNVFMDNPVGFAEACVEACAAVADGGGVLGEAE